MGEFICLVSLFTTPKYYPSDSSLFVERLLRYCRTLGRPPGSDVVFEYMSVRKDRGRFESVPVAEYTVGGHGGGARARPVGLSPRGEPRLARPRWAQARSYAPAGPAR